MCRCTWYYEAEEGKLSRQEALIYCDYARYRNDDGIARLADKLKEFDIDKMARRF